MIAKGGKDAKVSMPPVCLLEIDDEVRILYAVKDIRNSFGDRRNVNNRLDNKCRKLGKLQ